MVLIQIGENKLHLNNGINYQELIIVTASVPEEMCRLVILVSAEM